MTAHENDRNLLREVMGGSASATDTFIDRMRCIPRMLASLNRRLGGLFSREELADIAQETFAKLWSRLGSFEGGPMRD